ncbi:dihydrodipicolinate synthase family protein [Brucella sp. IR073]|uniref:dihydrodipicolinate synthase family protein n=1 Tax=unclassified Brucella TaxID=2632610 RepID=UPI003B9804CC
MRFGLSVALATPFEKNGYISLDVMIAKARHSLDAGCSSVTLFGTTGEGASIGRRERETLLGAMVSDGVPADRIVAGVLVNSAADAAEQAAHALSLGARNILLAPPSYFKNLGDEGLFGWFSAVFGLLGDKARDVILYHIPSVTMVPLSHALIGRLREAFPEIVTGVKDSGGDWAYTEKLVMEHGDLIILIGDERHLAKGVRLGAQGAISGIANFLPSEVRRMAVRGEDDQHVIDLVAELLKYPVTPGVKALMAHAFGEPHWLAVRPPLLPLSNESERQLVSTFDTLFRSKAA